jgi:hypothetical protein
MKCVTLLILILGFHFLFVGCAPKYVYLIQIHETIEDAEFEGMYGQEGIHDLPETGIVVENSSDVDFTVRFEGVTIRRVSVLSEGTSSAHLPPGTYKFIVSTEDPAQPRSQSTRFLKAVKREIPIKDLTGEKTIREKCRTTFHVFLEKKAVE